jgi:hypothetical protein
MKSYGPGVLNLRSANVFSTAYVYFGYCVTLRDKERVK